MPVSAEYGSEVRTDDAEAWRLGIKASFTDETGLSADDVATALINGVEANRLFVFSHPHMSSIGVDRLNSVIEAMS